MRHNLKVKNVRYMSKEAFHNLAKEQYCHGNTSKPL